MTTVLQVDSLRPQAEIIARAAACLAEGGLVAFPTETVYGIGVNGADPAAVQRLRRLKDRPHEPFTRLLADVQEFEALCRRPSETARRLMERFWPGPLTLVCETSEPGGYLGLRVSPHPVARGLLRAARVPVLAPSANRRARAPADEAHQVQADFEGEVDLILDAGPTDIKQGSTVVRITGHAWEVLREGLITRAMVERVVTTRILFVCTGNTCRSPMAAALCQKLMAKRLGISSDALEANGFKVLSAGTSTLMGAKASLPAIKVMRERGLDIHQQQATPVTRALLDEANLVFALNQGHYDTLVEWCPDQAGKIRLLHPDGIVDPIGHPIGVYAECADAVQECLEAFCEDYFARHYSD